MTNTHEDCAAIAKSDLLSGETDNPANTGCIYLRVLPVIYLQCNLQDISPVTKL